MRRLRSSMVLLGICVAALLIGLLRLATQRPPLPVGSSYSTEAGGAQALFDWSLSVGVDARRLQTPPDVSEPSVSTLVLIQPETPIGPDTRAAYDAVAQHAGTLVVAGDSVPWLLYVRGLGITVEPIRPAVVTVSAPDASVSFSTIARYRLRNSIAEPLLLTADGDWLALRMPYKGGLLIVVATPEPLSNASLHDDGTARFVYRAIISPAIGRAVLGFDEAHHSFAPPSAAGATVSINALLFNTPAGRAILYVAGLLFVYLILSGRRLGPAVAVHSPSETRRTMFEHVQMLANLHRRAGRLDAVRASFSRHYARRLARVGSASTRHAEALAQAVTRIEGARTEAELLEAVRAASDAR